MSQPPVSDEVAGALGRYFHGGSGPSHSSLTSVFLNSGYGEADPYNTTDGTPNKEARVQQVLRAAIRRPQRARDLVEGLLTSLRLVGFFDQEREGYDRQRMKVTQAAFRRLGWSLSSEGTLSVLGQIDLVTGGREALEEQVERLRKAADDPAQLLGTAKETFWRR